MILLKTNVALCKNLIRLRTVCNKFEKVIYNLYAYVLLLTFFFNYYIDANELKKTIANHQNFILLFLWSFSCFAQLKENIVQ